MLLVKAVALPALLFAVLRRTREPRLVAAPRAGPLVRSPVRPPCAAAVALVPPLGLGDARAEQAAVALVRRLGIVVARRRGAVFPVCSG